MPQTTNTITGKRLHSDQTLLAFDYGVKKMGVAVGNTVTQTANPLAIIAMNNGQPNWQNLLELILHWQATTIVVGLPFNMDGTDSILSKRAHKFARRLAHQLKEIRWQFQLYLVDERLSSKEARQLAWQMGLLKESNKPIDNIAACILLSSWLQGNTGVLLP